MPPEGIITVAMMRRLLRTSLWFSGKVGSTKFNITTTGTAIVTFIFYESIADSVQTEYCTTFLLAVCSSVTGVTSHISHIYKGINAMLIIRGPIKPYIFWIKIILAIFLAKTRPTRPSSPPWPTWPLILTDQKNYQKDKCRIRCVYFVLFGRPSTILLTICDNFQ